MSLLIVLLGAVLSGVLTGLVRRYALAKHLLDHPNERSSHTRPTPRGGGLAIVVCFSATTLALGLLGLAPWRACAALLVSGLLVATVGLLDDRYQVAARWRMLVHIVSGVCVLWSWAGIPLVPAFGREWDLGWIGVALTLLYLVWMVNLYNFMDGIDGIASIQAITASLGGAACWWLATHSIHALVPVCFAACVAGFLLWNYPPAKIFMGDTGSGFIGMTLGTLSIWAAHETNRLFWCWMILSGCFMVDATTTFCRRAWRGERVVEPHRSHAYQHASRVHGSHKKISLAIGAINLLWLFPLSMAVATDRLDGVVGVAIAYAPLVVLAYRYKAGARDEQLA